MKIIKPTFIVNETVCKRNIEKVFRKSQENNVVFRPHFKTHRSAKIAEWFREYGVEKITVSSVGMANYFYKAGWKDILIAFPVNIHEIEKINELAGQIKLYLIIESVFTATFLAKNIKHPVGIYLKIDTGYHRTGLEEHQQDEMEKILAIIKSSEMLRFTGLLTHAGHTYDAKNTQEIKDIYHSSTRILNKIKARSFADYPESIISIGDTPSCSVIEDFSEVDEIRPGNFVFYDLMQYNLGVCTLGDIAVSMACPVVAKHKSRYEIVIYGGAAHLSAATLNGGSFGLVVNYINGYNWENPLPDTFVKSVSQEHGIIKTTAEIFDQIKIGEVLGILPVHLCLTANLANEYQTSKYMKLSKY